MTVNILGNFIYQIDVMLNMLSGHYLICFIYFSYVLHIENIALILLGFTKQKIMGTGPLNVIFLNLAAER